MSVVCWASFRLLRGWACGSSEILWMHIRDWERNTTFSVKLSRIKGGSLTLQHKAGAFLHLQRLHQELVPPFEKPAHTNQAEIQIPQGGWIITKSIQIICIKVNQLKIRPPSPSASANVWPQQPASLHWCIEFYKSAVGSTPNSPIYETNIKLLERQRYKFAVNVKVNLTQFN